MTINNTKERLDILNAVLQSNNFSEIEPIYKSKLCEIRDSNEIEGKRYSIPFKKVYSEMWNGLKFGKPSSDSIRYFILNADFNKVLVNEIYSVGEKTRELIRRSENLQKYLDSTLSPDQITKVEIIGIGGVDYSEEFGWMYHIQGRFRQSMRHEYFFISVDEITRPIINKYNNEPYVFFDKYNALTVHLDRLILKHQEEAIKFMLKNKKCVIADGMGLGKAQDVNTLIPTPNGLRKLGDLKVGDELYDQKGNVVYVESVHPQGMQDIYDIRINNGRYVNSTLDHLWVVREMGSDEIVTRSLGEIIEYNKLELGNTDTFLDEDYNPIVRFVNPPEIEYPEAELPFPIKDLAVCISEYAFGDKQFFKNSDVVNYLKELNYLGDNIRIPEVYLKSSLAQRRELFLCLRELMYELATKYRRQFDRMSVLDEQQMTIKSKDFLNDMLELLDSMSIYYDLDYDKNQNVYILHIPVSYNKLYMKDITKRDEQCEAVCIRVSSEDSTYLTEGHIPTHNTCSAVVGAIELNTDKVLIVTNASIKTTWERELALYVDKKDIQIVQGKEWEDGKKFNIINYDILKNFHEVPYEPVFEDKLVVDENGVSKYERVPVMVKNKSSGEMVQKMRKSRKKDLVQQKLNESKLFNERFDLVIIDEVHKLSNNNSIRYKTIHDLLGKLNPNYVFLLSGTPILNKPLNLYHILKLIDADITKYYRPYVLRYCDGKTMRLKDGREILLGQGASNLDELKERIKHLYIRRISSDMEGMVGKTILTKIYDLDDKQRSEYNKLWLEYENIQQEQGNFDSEEYRQLVEGMLIRQYLANEMIPYTIELADNHLEEPDKKVVIITNFQDEMDELKRRYGDKAVTFNGKMNMKQKLEAETAFQNDSNVRVFIGNSIATAEGLTLTSADLLIFNSFTFVSATNQQLEDRIYRITQKNNVTIIYQLFANTYLEDMYDIVLNKKNIMDNTIIKEAEKKLPG